MNINPMGKTNSNNAASFGHKHKEKCDHKCESQDNSTVSIPRPLYNKLLGMAMLAMSVGGPLTSCEPTYITPEHIIANLDKKDKADIDSTYTVIPEDSIYDEQDSIVSPPKIDSTANESGLIFNIMPPPASNPKVKDVPPVYVDSIPNKKGPVAPPTEEDSTATESRHIFKICPPPSENKKTKDVPPVNPTPSKKK